MSFSRPRYGVAGYPVAHSRSPRMHRAAYEALGIDAEYLRLPIAAELFEETVRSLPGSGFAGINVTIPHKEAAAAIADHCSEAVKEIGAANTLKFTSRGIEAENTDAIGLIRALDMPLDGLRTLVLGAGGTGRAAVWALKQAGAEVHIWNRSDARAIELADEFGVNAQTDAVFAETAELIVNTTVLGMEPNLHAADLWQQMGIVRTPFGPQKAVVDFVYGDHVPVLTQSARDVGLKVIDGRELLVRQGAASFELWFGRPAPLDAMRNSIVG